MAALVYLAETLLALALWSFLLRLLLQWVRADFRNPLARALVQITTPVLVPLRRLLPPIGRFDTASGVVVSVLALAHAAAAPLLYSHFLPSPPTWALIALFMILRTLLWTFFAAIFLYALLSLIAPGSYSPAQALLTSLAEPVLRPFRRLIPPLGGLDLSPLWAIILIQALLILLG
ncbi:MAG: YggT family protein [Gammaproteobacteria bacterium]|nr:YggT family protein [Gammaproteobacteria bacterium]